MNIATIRGRGSAEEAERILMHGFNGRGDEITTGQPMCWDIASSDGKTMTQAASGTNFSNFAMFAGLPQRSIGTAEYSADILAYGVGNANVYGVATTLVPGANLALVAARSYVAYGSHGMFAGSVAAQQPIAMTSLSTVATVDEFVAPVFIKAL